MADSKSSNPLKNWTRYRARIALAALTVIAGWEIAALAVARERAPSDEAWRTAAAEVAAELRPDDLVVAAPPWVDPLVRRWFGETITLAAATRMDEARFGRIWEVSIRGAEAPEVDGGVPEYDCTFGGVRVRRFNRFPSRVTWDLRASSRICEVDFRPRAGVNLALRQPGDRASVRFEDVTLGTELQIFAGIASSDHRKINCARALLRVLVDDVEVGSAVIGNDSGWRALPTAETNQGIHDVELVAEVEQAWGPIVLDLCVAAEGRFPP